MDLTYSTTFSTEEVMIIISNKLKHKNFNVTSFETTALDKNMGLLGIHVSLKVIVVAHGVEEEFKFFCKFFPKHEGPAHFASLTGAFKKEIFAYNIFEKITESGIDLLSDCITNLYYFKDNHVIVMDDLKQTGFQCESHIITNINTITAIVKNLAKLHASSIIYEEKLSKTLGRKFTLLEEYKNNFEETFYNDKEGFINKPGVTASINGIMTEIELFKHSKFLTNGKEFKTTARNLCYKIYDLAKPSKKYRNVINHGDLWTNNFLIKYESGLPIACKFVDFQLLRYVPPAQDLLSLIYLSTTRCFRQKYMYEIIGLYYATLEKYMKLHGFNLNEIITFGNFMESCEEQKLFAIIQSATYFQLVFVDTLTLEEFFHDKELYNKTFFEDRSLIILKYIDKNEEYKSRLQDSILDLRDYCETVPKQYL